MPHDQPRPQGAFPWLSRWGGKRPWHRRVRPSFWLVDYERKRPNKSNLWITQIEMVENVSTPTKISKITYINQSKWRSDPPMPGPFPAHLESQGKSPWGRGCLETPSFWRCKENYVNRNAPGKFQDFREVGLWCGGRSRKITKGLAVEVNCPFGVFESESLLVGLALVQK